MSETFKICPICRASNHRNATICVICGTTLTGIPIADSEHPTGVPTLQYDHRYGETDLYERDLRHIGRTYLTAIFVTLFILTFGGLVLALGPSLRPNAPNNLAGSSGDATTNTPTQRPTLSIPTVTPGPPTPSPTDTPIPMPTPSLTPTQEPCYQQVRPGEGLYAVVARCGHLSFDILPTVVAINGLVDANSIQEGQTLEIPWPTASPDPNASPTEIEPTQAGEEADVQETIDVFALSEEDLLEVPTATLQAGVQFHTVQAGETLITIGLQYSATAEILSQLNPELTFSQCDFGETFGGPRCTVLLIEGQQIRVPAPTPTPTIPPTSSGSETPTPSPTATFNAPRAQSPSDRAFFRRNELITLRWVPTGTLGPEQTYQIRVEDLTAGIVYTATTNETSFIIPEAWQGQDDQRHEYIWSVSVIDTDDPGTPRYTTQMYSFTWEGLR